MTRKIEETWVRGSKKFREELNEILNERRMSIDKNLPKTMGTSRLLDLVPKMPQWKQLKEALKKVPKQEDLQ